MEIREFSWLFSDKLRLRESSVADLHSECSTGEGGARESRRTFGNVQRQKVENLFDTLATDRYGLTTASPGSSERNRHASESSPTAEQLRPKLDLIETDGALIATIELPGARKEDISIELTSGRLTISGRTQPKAEHTKATVKMSERQYGAFRRTIAVSEAVTHQHIKAAFDDGVLNVTVPKIPAHSSHKISIS
ncbi:hypothetical protein O181_088362 [Austropuccinia psidii MF-1]|uniref:SHSP domain-containing protein n=1 Tax=Austropuccinia psidii MF-1 TaxID=1389203 RepID=A0A9Q3P4Z3_9BASI|nr:hypothetical protein [Austropuccinia psidii MF-1]